jgi:hypothetical protein
MNSQSSPGLITVLQSTLKQLEQTEEMGPEDPALLELKRSIARILAEREIKKASTAEGEPDQTALSPA